MKGSILVIDADKQTCSAVCSLLEAHHYVGIPSYTLADLYPLVEKTSCPLVMLDLDTVEVDNRYFRDLKKRWPSLFIITLSHRAIHPELKEALGNYIYACLSKPVDPDELIYLVEGIFAERTTTEEGFTTS